MRKRAFSVVLVALAALAATPAYAQQSGSAAWGDRWDFKSPTANQVDLNTATAIQQMKQGGFNPNVTNNTSLTENIANQTNVGVSAVDSNVQLRVVGTSSIGNNNQSAGATVVTGGGNAGNSSTTQTQSVK